MRQAATAEDPRLALAYERTNERKQGTRTRPTPNDEVSESAPAITRATRTQGKKADDFIKLEGASLCEISSK